MFKLAPIAALFWTTLSVANLQRIGAWTVTKSTTPVRLPFSSHSSGRSSASSFSLAASLSTGPPLSGIELGSARSSATAANDNSSNNNDGNSVDWDWRSVAQTAFSSDQRPILLFDGVCNFCNGGVNLALDLDSSETGVLRFCSLQSITGQSLLLQAGKKRNDLSTVVLVASLSQQYFESEAVMRTAELLQGLPAPVRWASKLSRYVLPGFVRNAAYQVVGRNRYLFGERETVSCRFDFDGTLQSRFLEDPADIVESKMEKESGQGALAQ